jgi:hypothetical protein
MAKITLDLNRFKASGIYTIEFDASEFIVVSTQTIRLIVGFSRIGPFNSPVFLQDIRTARRVFGTIDTTLEARGSFFHRAIETAVGTGPIFALNLLPLNNVPVNEGGDAVDYRSFALAANEMNGEITRALYASFYNKERFWFPDVDYLQATVDSKPVNRGRLFNVVNLGQTVQSVIIKKSTNAPQYNITAEDYYGADEIPSYVYKSDYMSDYFVDVYVVRGDWTNLTLLAKDPVYSKYFDLRGLRADRLEAFLSLDGITLTASFTGCIIPNFLDNNGSNQSIDVIVNQQVATTGLFLNLNEDALDDYANSLYKVDMIGNTLINTTDDILDFLSYNTPIKSVLSYTGKDDVLLSQTTIQPFNALSGSVEPYIRSIATGGKAGKFGNVLVLPRPIPSDITFTPSQWEAISAALNTRSLISSYGTLDITNSATPNDYLKVDNVVDTGTELLVYLSNPAHEDANYYNATYGTGAESDYIESTVCAAVPTIVNTIDVTSFTNLTAIISAGDVILVEANGYSKYYEVSSYTPAFAPGVDRIVVNAAPTVGGPLWLNKWCVPGFAADEFSAFQQPAAISVTVWATSVIGAQDLVPSLLVNPLQTSFGYIAEPAATIANVLGLGQTTSAAAENFVSISDTTGAFLGNAYIYGSFATTNGYDLVYSSPTYGGVNVLTAAGLNAFNILGVPAGNQVVITLPGGQEFTGFAAPAAVVGIAPTLTGSNIATLAYIESYPGSKLSKNINGNLVIDGDRVKYDTGSSAYNYLNVDAIWGKNINQYSKVAYGLPGSIARQYTDSALQNPATNFATLDNTYIDTTIQLPAALGENVFAIYSSLAKNIQSNIAIETPGLYAGGKKFNLTQANAANLEIGDFLVNNDTVSPKLTRVTAKVKKLDPATGTPYFEYTVIEVPGLTTSAGISYVTKFTPLQKFADRYQFTRFSGFKMTDYHLPGTPAQLEKILGVLETTNVGETLASRDVIQFRYIVDTFNGGLEPQMGPKQYLSRLAKNRQQCMALLNSPSMAEFQASTDPRFTELPDAAAGNPKPVLNTEYIATGGNLSLGPSYTWGLPDEENGAKYIGVFTPNVILRENGKNISIPPAAHVSNNFVAKFVNGTPYAIVAGPRRGVLSDPKFVGLEYDFLLKDRENLEPVGLNPIVVVRNVGPMIFANQTAYQRTLSAFNNLHVRDLLITIEEGVIEILQNYLFEFNDAATRLEIRTIVETYLDVVRNAGGVQAYSVIMDDTNNTNEIIDQNFGIIDIGIEPTRGLQKFINRITVLKTGAIASGGFAAV